jgi:hypothetical protein
MNLIRKHRQIQLSVNSALTDCRRLLFGLLAVLFFAGADRLAAQQAVPSEYQVKAAFLYNFGKFVEWPTNTFVDASAPLVIGVFGDSPFHGDLDQIVRGRSIGGHPVVVRHISTKADLKGCDIVFVSLAEQKHAAAMSDAIQHFGVLTVTENMKHFMDSGYIINFITEGGSIHFEINNAKANEAGLTIRSKLLGLARTSGA